MLRSAIPNAFSGYFQIVLVTGTFPLLTSLAAVHRLLHFTCACPFACESLLHVQLPCKLAVIAKPFLHNHTPPPRFSTNNTPRTHRFTNMSSTTEHQNETPPRSDSVSPSKDGDNAHLNKSHDGMPPAPKPAKDVFDIATEFATSRLGNLTFEEGKETVANKASDEEFFSDEEVEHPVKVGENTDPKLTAGTASNSENASGASTKKNEEATTSQGDQEVSHRIKANENIKPKLTSETASKPEDTSSATSKKNEEVTTPESNDTTTDVPRDETATPRLAAYIKLHNDVSPPSHRPPLV